MTYILIVATWFSGYVGGYAITTSEFTSKEACERAATAVAQLTADGRVPPKTKCVER